MTPNCQLKMLLIRARVTGEERHSSLVWIEGQSSCCDWWTPEGTLFFLELDILSDPAIAVSCCISLFLFSFILAESPLEPWTPNSLACLASPVLKVPMLSPFATMDAQTQFWPTLTFCVSFPVSKPVSRYAASETLSQVLLIYTSPPSL